MSYQETRVSRIDDFWVVTDGKSVGLAFVIGRWGCSRPVPQSISQLRILSDGADYFGGLSEEPSVLEEKFSGIALVTRSAVHLALPPAWTLLPCKVRLIIT